MALVWDADTIIWNFIINRGINISVALLGISSGNSMVFLHNTRGINPGVSNTLRSYLLDGGFSLDESGVLFLCLNISTSISVKPVRGDLNVSVFLSCCFFSKFSKCLRIC